MASRRKVPKLKPQAEPGTRDPDVREATRAQGSRTPGAAPGAHEKGWDSCVFEMRGASLGFGSQRMGACPYGFPQKDTQMGGSPKKNPWKTGLFERPIGKSAAPCIKNGDPKGGWIEGDWLLLKWFALRILITPAALVA